MSNPPFGSPLFGEEEDLFSFPIEPPNDPINQSINPNPLVIEEISPNSLPSTSIPMLDYQDLSMFLDDHHDENLIPLLGSSFPTITHEITIPNEWVREIEQVVDCLDDDDHDQVQQGAQLQGSSDGHGNHDQDRPIDHDDQGGEGSSMKKLDHNAKERVRRMKLNSSYLGLRSLLPHSKKAKEKWSAPYIIDRALDYIPQLQAEIDKLTLEKSNMISVIGEKQQVQEATITSDLDNQQQVHKDHPSTSLTVSINEVRRGEVIIQICHQKDKLDHNFSALFEKLEGEDFVVVGASSLCVSEDRSCFHLHVQIGETLVEADYVAVLHKKLISWLS